MAEKTTLKRIKIQGRTAAEVAKRYGIAAGSIKKRGDSFILPKTASLLKGMGTRSATAIDRAASADKQRAARYETGKTTTRKIPATGGPKRVLAFSNVATQGGLGPANKRRVPTAPFRTGGGSKYATATPASPRLRPGSGAAPRAAGTVRVTKTAEQTVRESGKTVTKGYGKANKPAKSGYGKTRKSRFFVRTGRGRK